MCLHFRVEYYEISQTVDIGCDDTSILDRIIYSREECKNLQLMDIAHKAWQDHNANYATHTNCLYDECAEWED